ncbi:MAG: putative quinol monooxygenase [Sphingobium sp.]
MTVTRRETFNAGLAGLIAGLGMTGAASAQEPGGARAEWGQIIQFKALPGKRAEVIDLFRRGIAAMPGSVALLIGEELDNPDGFWVVEYWETHAVHDSSLKLPEVAAIFAQLRPMIAGAGTKVQLHPV